jgi:hypothetical protein
VTMDAPSSTSPILTDPISRVRAASEADDVGPEQVRALLTDALSRGDDWLDKQHQDHSGRERETWFRRLDDGSSPGNANREVDQSWVNTPGTVTIAPDGTIHPVEAIDGEDAVSIHIYGTDIVTQERSTSNVAEGTEEPFYPPFSQADEIKRQQRPPLVVTLVKALTGADAAMVESPCSGRTAPCSST